MTTLVYCDASVLVARLVADDAHREVVTVLEQYVAEDAQLISSELAALEVSRAMNRLGSGGAHAGPSPGDIDASFDDIDLMSLDRMVIDVARRIPDAHLGSLDAIHVASALLAKVDVVITRDRRMAAACKALGLQTI